MPIRMVFLEQGVVLLPTGRIRLSGSKSRLVVHQILLLIELLRQQKQLLWRLASLLKTRHVSKILKIRGMCLLEVLNLGSYQMEKVYLGPVVRQNAGEYATRLRAGLPHKSGHKYRYFQEFAIP